MARQPRQDPKIQALKAQGALNPDAEAISDPLFQGSEFFDPRDRVQAKYEMLRRADVDGQPVTRVSAAFGVSRPTFYQAKVAFEREGLAGLLPKKRGPHGGHKLTQEVMDFIAGCLEQDASQSSRDLARQVKGRFGLDVHGRSIERALERQKKNGTDRGAQAFRALPADLADRYEDLRFAVAGSMVPGSRSRGLVLFLREGMAAWIKAWATLAPCSAEESPQLAGAAIPLPIDLHGDIARIVTEMAFSAHQEVTA